VTVYSSPLPGTAAVAHRKRETGSSRSTQGTARPASRRKTCACSSTAVAREAGSHGCSRAFGRSFRSSSSLSGHGSAAARMSVSAGSSRSDRTSRARRARGNCVRSTCAHRSSPSTCRMTSCPAWTSLLRGSRRERERAREGGVSERAKDRRVVGAGGGARVAGGSQIKK
jgi:hypothetical protein